MMWFGSSVVAILAGPAGDAAVGTLPFTQVAGPVHIGGLTSAFDLAIVVLLIGLVLISVTWQENNGAETDVDENTGTEKATQPDTSTTGNGPAELLASAGMSVMQSPQLLALMGIVVGFESATYCFVFNWTPSLTEGAATPPALGSVFATLMLAYMSGSLSFQLLGPPRQDDSEEGGAATRDAADPLEILLVLLVIAPLALLMSTLALTSLPQGSSERTAAVLAGFVIFEFCCGLYAPAVSAAKAAAVPESLRGSVYSIYRAPMNAVVVAVLLSGASTSEALGACIVLLGFAGAAGLFLKGSLRAQGSAE